MTIFMCILLKVFTLFVEIAGVNNLRQHNFTLPYKMKQENEIPRLLYLNHRKQFFSI